MTRRALAGGAAADAGGDRTRAWLLPVFSRVCRWAARAFYRFRVAGRYPPPTGPVLFAANHPNSLLDPVLVAAAAGRPVRFLAKAPLFVDPKIGWLVRAAGAIPVHRRLDDPGLMERNVSTFRSAHEALGAGAAVGIFPEGLSHSEPGLAELRTGAARIALGASLRLGRAFPIVPVGIVLRNKERFRSEALAVVGEPVVWEDLAGRPEDDVVAVHALMARVEGALRAVTVNLERWEDAPAVEAAEAIYAAEMGLEDDPARRVGRLRQVTDALARLRREEPERSRALSESVLRFRATCEMLGTSPGGLDEDAEPRAAAGWLARRLLFFLVGAPLALAGHVVFAIPFGATDRIVVPGRLDTDVRATWKLLGGVAVHAVWVLLLSGIAAVAWGLGWGIAALVLLPDLGFLTLAVRERWSEARTDARRWLLLRRRRGLRQRLLARRAALAAEIDSVRARLAASEER